MRPADPAEDLELLERARSLVDVDQLLDFGPWWYAPLLATMIGGLTLFGHDIDDLGNVAAGVAAVAAAAVVAIHDYRRRKVRLRRSARGLAFLGLITALCWLLIAAWGTALSSLGYDRFVPGYAFLAWTLTSIALLVIRNGSQMIRRHQPTLR